MNRDIYETPPWLYERLSKYFTFVHDVCCQHSTAKVPTSYWTKEDDALSKNWGAFSKGDFLWCNPPYSNPLPWVKKAIEAQQAGVGVVMLLLIDPSTEWYVLASKYCSEMWFLCGKRISFHYEGKRMGNNRAASLVIIFDPKHVGRGRLRNIHIGDL